MKNPFALYVVFVVLTIAGGIGIFVLILCWRKAGDIVGDWWPKPAAEIIQVLSALTSIGTTFASIDDRATWIRPALTAWASLLVWKLLQILIDRRMKIADRTDKAALQRAEAESELRTRLLAALREAVNRKVKRLRREVGRKREKPSLTQVRNALTPQPHLEEMLDALAVFLKEQLPPKRRSGSNFRVGVYINREGTMTPIHGVSLDDAGYNPFRSHSAHQEFFQINGVAKPASVVISVREKRLVILEDCLALETSGEFSFFNDNQRSYLRSLVAYYLGEVCLEDGTMTEATLAIDTNLPGFFKEEDSRFAPFLFGGVRF